MGRWKERKKEAQSAKARRMEYDYWGGGQWRGVVWKRNSTSQVNPRGSDGDGEGKGAGLCVCACGRRRRGVVDGGGQRTELERGCRGARVSRSLAGSPLFLSGVRSVGPSRRPKESRTTGHRVPLQRETGPFRGNGEGASFRISWLGGRERESEPDVLSGASSD